ncbi:unnamed protein product [Allacma fusca]|uniref:Galactosylgalactosylxylosylprotein 3-beta-glucuronosyltransferase n=1 Tax=Allacma fusca TaxID=39272 RepID=A0A8J2J182_9HEXA|nr:unnamed protein product [Allacma fusca]
MLRDVPPKDGGPAVGEGEGCEGGIEPVPPGQLKITWIRGPWTVIQSESQIQDKRLRTLRSILLNTCLFALGILTTLLIISNREETIDLCEPTVSTNPVAAESKIEFILKGGQNNLNNVNSQDDGQRYGNPVGQSLPVQSASVSLSTVVALPGGDDPSYFDTSVSINKLQLPFSSKVRRNLVYVVTPTYNRPEQIPELTRLAQALLQVNHLIHWVVVEDVDRQTSGLEKFLNKFNLQYSLLKSVKPKVFDKVVGKPRGVGARRASLEWLRLHQFTGVVYFADDDNTYDSDIFRQMQRTKKVSMWPVGLVTELGVSSPIVRQGKVIGFYDGWRAYRKFPVDMAGFAINLKLIHAKKNANMPWVAGYEEDEILRSLGITLNDIQPLASNCTEILVWHTKSAKNNWSKKAGNLKTNLEESTNLRILLKKLPLPNANDISSMSKSQRKNSENSGGFSFMKLLLGN